ncbi:MAG TPA: hypothetical protein VN445_02685 [Rectinemataceae bacterium]|nr:hypothetical protein [Rectinemataceae bacterium]
MKKIFICMVLILCVSVPAAFSQFRFEIGASAPITFGAFNGETSDFADVGSILDEVGIIPIPNLALLLQLDAGPVKLGAGIKAWTALVASAAYPIVQAEIALGSLSIDASLGGYFLAYYGVPDTFGFEEIGALIPDISVWLGIGKKNAFRIGGGAMGLIPTSFDLTTIPYVAYAGLKVVLQ